MPQFLVVLELEAPFEQSDFIVLLEYLPELLRNDLVEYVQIVGYDKGSFKKYVCSKLPVPTPPLVCSCSFYMSSPSLPFNIDLL